MSSSPCPFPARNSLVVRVCRLSLFEPSSTELHKSMYMTAAFISFSFFFFWNAIILSFYHDESSGTHEEFFVKREDTREGT